MILAIVCLFATVAAGPVTYDQRQDGAENTQIDVSNVLFVFAIPKKLPNTLFDLFSKRLRDSHGIQDRASSIRVMETFVKPDTPYRVEIRSDQKSDEDDGRSTEIVIAGRRRLEIEQPNSQEQDDLKLLGATENCGPDRIRDSVTLRCKDKSAVEESVVPDTQPPKKESSELQPAPEVVSS